MMTPAKPNASAGVVPGRTIKTSSPLQAVDEYSQAMTTTRVPSFTGPYNLTGMPAISVPCGFNSKGLPIGLQLAGKPFDEPTVLRAAYTFQQQVRLFEKRPPV